MQPNLRSELIERINSSSNRRQYLSGLPFSYGVPADGSGYIRWVADTLRTYTFNFEVYSKHMQLGELPIRIPVNISVGSTSITTSNVSALAHLANLECKNKFVHIELNMIKIQKIENDSILLV